MHSPCCATVPTDSRIFAHPERSHHCSKSPHSPLLSALRAASFHSGLSVPRVSCIVSGFIHNVHGSSARCSTSFLSWLNAVPCYGQTTLTLGMVCWEYVCQGSAWTCVFLSLGCVPGSGVARSPVLCPTQQLHHLTFPPQLHQGAANFSTPSTTLFIICSFDQNCLSG